MESCLKSKLILGFFKYFPEDKWKNLCRVCLEYAILHLGQKFCLSKLSIEYIQKLNSEILTQENKSKNIYYNSTNNNYNYSYIDEEDYIRENKNKNIQYVKPSSEWRNGEEDDKENVNCKQIINNKVNKILFYDNRKKNYESVYDNLRDNKESIDDVLYNKKVNKIYDANNYNYQDIYDNEYYDDYDKIAPRGKKVCRKKRNYQKFFRGSNHYYNLDYRDDDYQIVKSVKNYYDIGNKKCNCPYKVNNDYYYFNNEVNENDNDDVIDEKIGYNPNPIGRSFSASHRKVFCSGLQKLSDGGLTQTGYYYK